mmetsp:Transcript_5322/g.33404  ORF Transcript_5322/g.33404 Transcript_5322/m.33404 type:complete len:257 (-) Transcript_5322:1866-2636(-)
MAWLTVRWVGNVFCSCSVTFDSYSVHGHTSCVTEHEKYALGATKPGGVAGKSLGQAQNPTGCVDEGIVGAQFLATRPPWHCSCCNVTATSKENLLTHAEGRKHKSKARARLSASDCDTSKKQKTTNDRPAQQDHAQLQASNGTQATPDEDSSQENRRKACLNGDACTSHGANVNENAGKVPTEDLDWKKFAKRILKDAKEGKMRRKKLLRRILRKSLGMELNDDAEIMKLMPRMVGVLARSSRFEVKDSTVVLAKR